MRSDGYAATPDHVRHERKVGVPIKGFENRVPVSWIEKGYVTMFDKEETK